ncbi:uncharacterized protein DNG_00632 [Cephalotrichum gorgonifer]|uniref:Uncharacterized protein n=1 Tax=Cephalotrichum gorgonifer TaxID=2041049 RepID=A0AAE8MRB5_9PEZI|nr:uncharacterized protein DNG_00632 [Cephalotrichum gorgonifer]
MSTTALEQDFTVEGKRGTLSCPFSVPPQPQDPREHDEAGEGANPDPTPHHSADPICAGMLEGVASQPAPAAASKCPIRYMDQHSPEEIANYVKTHKNDLPRSHAICVERYQRNENQIRKLDAKYGNIVSMIESLGQLHKPMLPVSEDSPDHDVDRHVSNQRVENWAQDVSANAKDFPPEAELPTRQAEREEAQEPDREGRFDRPMKEIRVGESPSRPWGISIPVYEYEVTGAGDKAPSSPPPAPVLMPAGTEADAHELPPPPKPAGKCPFDHTKFAGLGGLGLSHPSPHDNTPEASRKPPKEQPSAPQKEDTRPHTTSPPQPTFLNPPQLAQSGNSSTPQMVFTGPVFIGYPMDDAIRFMQAFQGR